MRNVFAKIGCFLVVATPLLGLFLYPRANWLFAILPAAIVVFVALSIWQRKFGKDPTPEEIATDIEKLLSGDTGAWDVDEFESGYIRDPGLQAIKRRCLHIGLPETWHRASEESKAELRGIIEELRKMQSSK